MLDFGEVKRRSRSKPLTFGELAVGDCFIPFPMDGDDAGHGGYRAGGYVFEKVADGRAVREKDGRDSTFPPGAPVYKVIL